MYRREKPLMLKGSTSAIENNLTVAVDIDKSKIYYASVHRSFVNLVCSSIDGCTATQRQISCEEPSSNIGFTMIIQAKIMQVMRRMLLVITTQKGIQIFDVDSSIVLFWYSLIDTLSNEPKVVFGRGICSVLNCMICVGTSKGNILVLSIPPNGSNITLAENLIEHSTSICDLHSEDNRMVSADNLGNIIVWQITKQENISTWLRISKINGGGYPCTSLCLWRRDLVAAAYSTGQVHLLHVDTGEVCVEIAAHSRWITALDVATQSGMLVSVSEDSMVRVWKIIPGTDPEIELKFSDCLMNTQLQGVSFISSDGRAFAVTGYDSNELCFFSS